MTTTRGLSDPRMRARSVSTPTVAETTATAETSTSATSTTTVQDDAMIGSAGLLPLASSAPLHSTEPYRLPKTTGIGATNIHKYNLVSGDVVTPVVKSVYAPVPSPELPLWLDMNAKKPSERLPDRFVVGDGSRRRCFIGVDKRPGTPLDAHVQRIIARMPDKSDPEKVIAFVRDHILDVISFPPASKVDGSPELPWDLAINVDADALGASMDAASNDVVAALPRPSDEQFPVVPLERNIELGHGYCIQMALLASIVLERCHVPNNVVNGALLQESGPAAGHTWVELGDGRVLDPSWRHLSEKGVAHTGVANSFWLAANPNQQGYRYPSTAYPYVAVNDR